MNQHTEQQLEAIRAPLTKHCVVSAVPGSGKTTMLVGRIKNLIKNGHSKQLVITFTKKAAENLITRLEKVPQSIFVGTFHGFCFRFLKKNSPLFLTHKLLGANQSFRLHIWSSQVIKESMVSNEIEVADLVKLVDSCTDPDCPSWQSKFAPGSAKVKLVKKVLAKMRSEGYLQFQELLTETIKLLQNNPELLGRLQKNFPVVMVDEFQDTDATQVKLLQLILGDSGHLTAIGDPSQSIFGFRGGTPEVLINIEDHFGPANRVGMSKNFRSVDPILSSANNLISHNELRGDVFIDVPEQAQAEVIHSKYDSQIEEATAIAEAIKERGAPYTNNAALYRTNASAGPVEFALAKLDIPYDVGNSGGFFDLTEIKTLVSYLELCEDLYNIDALRWVWNRPGRYLKNEWLNKAAGECSSTSAVHVVRLTQTNRMGYQQKVAVKKLLAFLDTTPDLKMRAPIDVIKEIVKTFNYSNYLKELAAKSPAKDFDTIKASVQSFAEVCKEFNSITNLLAHIERMKLNYKRKEKVKKGVSLLTIHKSKGLEFPYVYLVNAVNGEIPHRKSTDIEEERRLMYVACTRAEKEFRLSYSGTPSPFIKELVNAA